ncbi:unnamed protein product [Callosobruchus maculatus]|uniref:Saposin B-type domain-containing protein n=1 Tax=Callosobruchus maculatus TaxID=64391 RepID=A0A653DFH4_CALMS|nr:unnamed protein product [Callosobruchus maculatus]
MKFLLSVLLSVICFSQAAEKLKVTVYYETLCLDCVIFFRKQLEPTYSELVEYIDLDLVPFGKGSAKKDGGKWKFECQHGEEECEVNAYDSCAVDIAPAPKAFAFAKCTMTQVAPTVKDMIKICAKKSEISYESVEACRQKRGDELLAKNAERSKKAGYTSIPALAFNDTFDETYSQFAAGHLKLYICSLLNDAPPQCKSQLYGF